MSTQVAFFTSIAFSLIAWWMVTSRYIWPRLRDRTRSEALRPLLILNSFRFAGLAFLVPGVVSPELPSAFAHAAAYGDLLAAILALLSLLTESSGVGIIFAWIFNVWGSVDLVNAFYRAGTSGLSPGQLGAAYFIPTLVVPLFLITHVVVFRILVRHPSQAAVVESNAQRGSAPYWQT